MKRKLMYGVGCVALLVAFILGAIKIYRVHDRDQCGILLAFDDYNAENWESYFDLFDEYDVKATFFVCISEPTDFCYEAKERGHEIGFHTAGHKGLTGLTEDEVYQQAIAPIEVFREKGIELTTFAYPQGLRNEALDEELLKYYKVVRGAFGVDIDDKHHFIEGYVESYSLDNVNYSSDEEFERRITEILSKVKEGKGRVVSLYSHAIEGGDWCVREGRLRFLFQQAKEMGLKFYTFQDIQKW